MIQAKIVSHLKDRFYSTSQQLEHFDWDIQHSANPYLLRPSLSNEKKYRNVDLFAIDYAFRPRLRIWL